MAGVVPELTPGAWIGVRFADDPGYVHERILSWPLGPPRQRRWIVLTRDGHEYAEALADWSEWFWLAGRSDMGYPPEVRDDEVLFFDEPVSDVAMLKIVRRGRALAPATLAELGIAAPATPKSWTG